MTGPEHYLLAENCLRLDLHDGDNLKDPARMANLLEAQVHATLALAAAAALNDAEKGMTVNDWAEWLDTCGVVAP
jgi:hypothetical protein